MIFRLVFAISFLLVPSVLAQNEPLPLNVFHGDIPAGDNIYYVAPDGDDDNDGAEETPFATVQRAIENVRRGDVIVMRGGVYYLEETLRIQSPSGFTDEMITLTAYPGEVPILDFSRMPRERNNHGVRLNANWWHVIGISIRNAAHNGIRMDGSFNILEQITAYRNHDSGIHMAGGASYNLIKNSDSFHNFNYITSLTPRVGNNADGFSAKFDALGPGNRYYGCRAWENSDDGFDFWRAPNTIVVENSWAFGNGDASVFADYEYEGEFEGNGNGFKLGGDLVHTPHIVRHSVAFDNFGSSGNAKGFDYNNNWGAMTLEHNTAYNNGRNFIFPVPPPEGQSVYINNLSVLPKNTDAQLFPFETVEHGNSWQYDEEVTADMFVSLDTEAAKGPRQHDGALPDIGLLKPVDGYFLVDGGVKIGRSFYGKAPDIGAFELVDDAGPVQPWRDVEGGGAVANLRVFAMDDADAWGVSSDFEVGVAAFVDDESATVLHIDEGISVDAWIRTAQSTRERNYLFPVADFQAASDSYLLIAHADSITEKPDWLASFEETGRRLIISDGEADHSMSVFRRVLAAGDSIALGRNSFDGTASAPMYLAMLGSATAVSAPIAVAPGDVELRQNFPNPFQNSTTISFTLPRPDEVSLKVFDVMGRELATIAHGLYQSGDHRIHWSADGLAGGFYLIRLDASNTSRSIKVVVLR